jgi:hypothetical protein
MKAHKVDANQSAIVEAVRKVGAEVQDLSAVGGGFPDLIVLFRGRLFLFEVKVVGGKLTPKQIEFIKRWGEVVNIVRSPEDALAAIGAIEIQEVK